MNNINPKEKFKLFKQTPNFCGAPWHLLMILSKGEVISCAQNFGKNVLGNLHDNTLEEVLLNQKRLEIKESMLRGECASNCKSCISKEQHDAGKEFLFLRGEYNKLFKKHDINYHDVTTFQLGALDLHWSSVCDLKCVGCRPEQSSAIALEQGVKVSSPSTPRMIETIDWIVKNQSTLTEVYLSGGEPTLIKYNLMLLTQLEKRPDLRIRVNSNLMWNTDNSILQEILKFPNVMFTCSADDIEQRFEYIRRGASWSKFISNLKFLLAQPNVSVRINSVFMVLSASTLLDTIDYFKFNLGINDFTINRCDMGHTYLHPRNCSTKLKEIVKTKLNNGIEKYKENSNLVGQLKNCLNDLAEEKTEDYFDYLDGIDKLAKTDWRTVFGELK